MFVQANLKLFQDQNLKTLKNLKVTFKLWTLIEPKIGQTNSDLDNSKTVVLTKERSTIGQKLVKSPPVDFLGL